jgi:hypothetical protein
VIKKKQMQGCRFASRMLHHALKGCELTAAVITHVPKKK